MTHRLGVLAALIAVLIGLGFAAVQLTGSNPSHGRASHPELQALAAKLERPRTVVMVIFDELPLTSLMGPDGRIDAERYPAFGGVARRSVSTSALRWKESAPCRAQSAIWEARKLRVVATT